MAPPKKRGFFVILGVVKNVAFQGVGKNAQMLGARKPARRRTLMVR